MPADDKVEVPRWAIEFILDYGCFQDEGPPPEGWASGEMRRAVPFAVAAERPSLFASAQTPPDVIDKLNAALNQALTLPALRDRLAQGASEVLGPTTPQQADAHGQAERARWVPFVRALRIDVE